MKATTRFTGNVNSDHYDDGVIFADATMTITYQSPYYATLSYENVSLDADDGVVIDTVRVGRNVIFDRSYPERTDWHQAWTVHVGTNVSVVLRNVFAVPLVVREVVISLQESAGAEDGRVPRTTPVRGFDVSIDHICDIMLELHKDDLVEIHAAACKGDDLPRLGLPPLAYLAMRGALAVVGTERFSAALVEAIERGTGGVERERLGDEPEGAKCYLIQFRRYERRRALPE